MGQLWADHTTDIFQKVTSSREVTLDDMQRVAAIVASNPLSSCPSVFFSALGTSETVRAPQTGSHSQRAAEEMKGAF